MLLPALAICSPWQFFADFKSTMHIIDCQDIYLI
jgi:hypothetical protein